MLEHGFTTSLLQGRGPVNHQVQTLFMATNPQNAQLHNKPFSRARPYESTPMVHQAS